MNSWTLDSWLVYPGREDEFIAAWTDLMHWTMREARGQVSSIPLYCDFQQSRRFFCPIAWESVEAIAAWRANQGYQHRIEHIEHLCTERETGTLMQVTKLSPGAAL
jgi:heme-degrading monooxygenase HmoA